MPTPLPTAKAQLESIRDRWVAARAASLAHARAQVVKAQSQRRHGYLTLGLSILVVPGAAALPSLPAEEYAWIPFAVAAVAGMSALSKFFEQRIVKPEEIGAHLAAERELDQRLDQLNLAAAHVHEFVRGTRQLDLDQVQEDVKRLQGEISAISTQTQVEIADEDRAKAESLFPRTSIHDALEGVKRRLAGDAEPTPGAAIADLPEDAAGIVAVRRRRPA